MLRRTWLLALIFLPATACAPAPAPASPRPSAATRLAAGCDAPEYHRLDFWVGSWDVKDAEGRYDGTDVVERGSGGCTLEEHWVDATGWRGESLFYFDRAAHVWKQVWVTATGQTKEKREEPGVVAGGARFQGAVVLPGGRAALDRTTLTPLDGGRVRQRIEQSTDGGVTWRAWEGTYEPLPRACTAPEHRRFDFWIGDWKVRVATRKAVDSSEWVQTRGSNHVTSILNGCAIREEFTAEGTPGSWSGTSLSMWQPKEGRWRQTWSDDSGSFLAFTGAFEKGEMTLVGEPRPDGRTMRMVFTDIAREHLFWRWEGSSDGKLWSPMMTIAYERAPAK